MIFDRKKIYNKLRCKWRELKKEHTELRQTENVALSEFHRAAMEYIKENGLKDPFGPREEDEKRGNAEIFQEDETKTIYRQAAIRTHPDKHGDEYIDIFKDIADAKDKGNLNKMLEEARKVDVKPEEISIKQLNVLEEEVNELERKTEEIMFSVHWIWYHANTEQRNKILEHVLNTQHA